MLDTQVMTKTTEDYYAELITLGQEAIGGMDRQRYKLGDLARVVKTHYGKSTMQRYAKDINCGVKSLYEYESVATFLEHFPQCRQFTDTARYPAMCWSIVRLAARISDPVQAEQFLHDAADNTWTIEQAQVEYAKLQGKSVPMKLTEFEATMQPDGDLFIFVLPEDTPLIVRQRYIVRVYQSED